MTPSEVPLSKALNPQMLTFMGACFHMSLGLAPAPSPRPRKRCSHQEKDTIETTSVLLLAVLKAFDARPPSREPSWVTSIWQNAKGHKEGRSCGQLGTVLSHLTSPQSSSSSCSHMQSMWQLPDVSDHVTVWSSPTAKPPLAASWLLNKIDVLFVTSKYLSC